MKFLRPSQFIVRHILAFSCLGPLVAYTGVVWAQVGQFRAVGGPGLERGEVVVPHATGAFLVCNSKLPEVDLLRAYLVHYDSELNVDWTRLLPCPALLQEVVDAWSDSPGSVTVMTRELRPEDGYVTVMHRLDSTGTWAGSAALQAPQNFRPVAHVEWLGEPWVVGATGSQPTAVNVVTGNVKTWGGLPGTLDVVTDAAVANNLLVVVGSRTQDDTTRTAIWGVYPFGQLAFENVGADAAAGAWSQADAVAVRGSNVRVLHSFHPHVPEDQWLLHSMLSVNLTSGQLNGILYGPQEGQRPGRDLISTPQGWVKLSQSDVVPQLDLSMLVTHYNPNGLYLSQGAWGTIFEDDPSHITQSEDGAIWVAGSTRGAIDGTWNACVLRLDSLGPLGAWSNDMPGFGTYNDPLFDDVLSITQIESDGGWTCAPNPAGSQTTLIPPSTMSTADRAALKWVLRDGQGRIVDEGQGTDVNLDKLAPGHHGIQVRDRGGDVHVRVLVVGER